MLQLPTRNGHRLLSNNNGTFNKTVVATDCFAVTAVLKFRTKRAHKHSSDFSHISHNFFTRALKNDVCSAHTIADI